MLGYVEWQEHALVTGRVSPHTLRYVGICRCDRVRLRAGHNYEIFGGQVGLEQHLCQLAEPSFYDTNASRSFPSFFFRWTFRHIPPLTAKYLFYTSGDVKSAHLIRLDGYLHRCRTNLETLAASEIKPKFEFLRIGAPCIN